MYIIKPGKLYDFMKYRRHLLVLSIILLTASAITFFKPGPKWGTDFRGGTEVEIAFLRPVTAEEVRAAVEGIKDASGAQEFEAPEVITVPSKEAQFLVRVQEVSAISAADQETIGKALCAAEEKPAGCTEELAPVEVKFSPGGDKITLRYDWKLESFDAMSADPNTKSPRQIEIERLMAATKAHVAGVQGISVATGQNAIRLVSERDRKVEVELKSRGTQLMEGIRAHFLRIEAAQNLPHAVPEEPLRIEWIGPKAGEQLRDAALKSVAIAMFFIMAYIALRFDLRFAPGAVVALIHDVAIAFGAMCVLQKEVTLSTVAAILTVLGYSLTDTVIVYDRVRENLAKHRGMSFGEIVNLSVSEMFGRTIITSSTAAASMLMFLFFGTQVLKDFAFVMLVGIGVGTYSSIYVAAPFTEWVDRRFFGSAVKARPKVSRTRGARKTAAVV
jgi:preprotein translocase subunit SecF